jgi:hypothetical protein
MFVIPTMATVAESDSPLIVCVNMTTSPQATIANEVVVSLSTMSGLGKHSIGEHVTQV